MKYATKVKHGTSCRRSGPHLCVKVATKRLSQEVLALRDSTTLSSIVVPRQRRGKSLMRRRYQQRHVFQKGRQRSEKWASDEPAYVRFWKDIPGQPDSKRTYVPLGVCRTRTIARGSFVGGSGVAHHESIRPAQKSMNAFNASFLPVKFAIGRGGEERVHACGIRAKLCHHFVGRSRCKAIRAG